VCDQDDGEPALLPQLLDEADHLVAGGSVQVAGRLVGQQHAWLVGQRPRDRDPLLLAARQLGWDVVGPLPEAHALQKPAGAAPPLRRAHRGGRHCHLHVLAGGQRRDQIELLEDEAQGVAA
jgi:acyl-CoA thioesterase-1